MANVKRFASVLGKFACKATPLSQLRPKRSDPLLFVCHFHKCKHFDFGFRIFWSSSFFFLLLFSALEEEDQLLHTNALAFEWATIAVCLCEYYLCSALEIYLHRTTNLSSANAE